MGIKRQPLPLHSSRQPRSFPVELVRGEYFTLVDLLKPIQGAHYKRGPLKNLPLKSLKLRLLKKPRLPLSYSANPIWTNKIQGSEEEEEEEGKDHSFQRGIRGLC